MDILRTTTSCLSRRVLLAGASALVSGCAAWPKLPPKPDGVRRVGVVDTHVHLFNASDLPIAGFLKFTALRAYADVAAVRALIDLFSTVVKPFSITVKSELAALERRMRPPPPEVSAERFAQLATNRSQGLEPQANPPAPTAALATDQALLDGYSDLAAILLAVNTGDFVLATSALEMKAAGQTKNVAQVQTLHRQAFLSAARSQGREPDRLEADAQRAAQFFSGHGFVKGQALGAADFDPAEFFSSIARTVSWGFILMQPRSNHLKRYLETFSAPDAQPVTIVNLLVDYDHWVGDQAADDSSLADQITFWAKAAEYYRGKIELRTFAGYCPLKHAYDRREHGEAGGYLAGLETAFTQGKIAGLKFYPPMGFYPIGNEAYDDAHFVGQDGVGDRVVKAWQKSPAPLLGAALDQALTETYAMCKRRGVPILSHAGPSNFTAINFADRPDPLGWGRVAQAYPSLHIMMGHFAFDAQEFVDAMAGRPTQHPVWAMTSTASVLKANPNVFIDLAYVNEILGASPERRKLATAFFEALHRYCVGADHNFYGQIAYGSDWIMLQREGDQRRYLEIMRKELTSPAWPQDAVSKIFIKNGERFLSPRPVAA